MNINMLSDADNDAGFYAAANGANTAWRGASLLRSSDGGASFAVVGAFDTPATMGTTVNALGQFAGGNIPDEINSLTVSLRYGELSSVSYASFINGAQSALVGDEIVCFRDATLNFDGSYTINGLLRARRGSAYAMTGHAAGERFVLLAGAAIKRIADVSASIGAERLYKAVTFGLADAAPQAFTNVGAGLKPYAPANPGGGRDAAGNLLLTWVRCNRIGGEWRDGVDVPMSEESERYEVDIFSDNSFTAVKRVLLASSTQAEYTAAQQVTDFGVVQGQVYLRVYQMSAIVGRGYAASKTI
jgi:hypothetical protein